jgi:hypothetical protein
VARLLCATPKETKPAEAPRSYCRFSGYWCKDKIQSLVERSVIHNRSVHIEKHGVHLLWEGHSSTGVAIADVSLGYISHGSKGIKLPRSKDGSGPVARAEGALVRVRSTVGEDLASRLWSHASPPIQQVPGYSARVMLHLPIYGLLEVTGLR